MHDGTGAPQRPGEQEVGASDAGWLSELAQTVAPALGPDSTEPRPGGGLTHRLETEPETVERDLLKLVLTIVELLRQLMERTALRRVEQGDLSEEQEERIGMTLMTLHDRMTELCERYDLSPDDLNLDLGPLGTLLTPGNT